MKLHFLLRFLKLQCFFRDNCKCHLNLFKYSCNCLSVDMITTALRLSSYFSHIAINDFKNSRLWYAKLIWPNDWAMLFIDRQKLFKELICHYCLGLKKHHLHHQSLNAPLAAVPRVLSKQPCDISTSPLAGVIQTKKLGLNPHKRGDHNRLFFCRPALPIVRTTDIMISAPSCWQVADKKRVVVTRVMMIRCH